ncbi:MAG TPA: hypothetical protein VN328_05605 [Thermodesulfovibrionales bacterium]|nr:hypothetical protein [Thermodesulfovibrionales bacterium]
MKGSVLVLGLIVFLLFGTFSVALADTLLFPVVAQNQPNVTTIISVINGGSSTHLRYTYRLKETFVGGDTSQPNISGTCATAAFTRPTFSGDLVSFDVSGVFNGGNALFSDASAYGGTFSTGGAGARRAYLLVSNSNAAGTRVDVANTTALRGEGIIMDISGGAAWGYRAVNDSTREDYSFINAQDGGGVYEALPDDTFNNRRFPFFPPNEWTTRFFVTPIGGNMDTAHLSATVNLISESGSGVTDRNGTTYTFSPIDKTPTCTAAVDLSALMDSTVWASIQATGGWTWVRVSTGDAIVFKLEYVVNNPTYGGTLNNGYLLSGWKN